LKTSLNYENKYPFYAHVLYDLMEEQE